MTEKTSASPKPLETPIASNFKKVSRQHGGILSGMVVLIILFSFINGSFFTANNITNTILQVSIIAVAAYGMTYVLLLDDINLSVDSIIALIGTLAALGVSWGIPFVLLVPLSTIAALALEIISGDLTAITEIPSFIATVVTMGIFRDIAYIVIDSMPIMIKDDAFLALGNGESLYIPIPIRILITLLLINHFILIKITFGRRTCITGGNKEVAIYSGIDVIRLKIKASMTTTVLASISEMILVSRLYSGQPNPALNYELGAIVAVVLGGASLNGGCGTVVGMVIDALTAGITNSGMSLMNVPYFYRVVVEGLVILVAVHFDVGNKRRCS